MKETPTWRGGPLGDLFRLDDFCVRQFVLLAFHHALPDIWEAFISADHVVQLRRFRYPELTLIRRSERSAVEGSDERLNSDADDSRHPMLMRAARGVRRR